MQDIYQTHNICINSLSLYMGGNFTKCSPHTLEMEQLVKLSLTNDFENRACPHIENTRGLFIKILSFPVSIYLETASGAKLLNRKKLNGRFCCE